jgi:hypothetical protein
MSSKDVSSSVIPGEWIIFSECRLIRKKPGTIGFRRIIRKKAKTFNNQSYRKMKLLCS